MRTAEDEISVLHVDDEPGLCDVVADFLEREDDAMSVTTATDPEEALELLVDGAFDCVVSDYEMPGRDGLAFHDAVRDEWDGPFILYTGKGSEAVASEALSRGVTEYLQKERGTDQYVILANRIRNAVEAHRAETAYREVFEKSASGIVLHDPDTGEILDANERYCEMHAYDRERIVGNTVGLVTADRDGYSEQRARRIIQRAKTEGAETVEWYNKHADGTEFPVEVRVRVAEVRGREVVLAAVRDISERKRRERALAELHDFATDVDGYDSVGGVCERTVEAAEQVLEFTHCTLTIEADGTLYPEAVSDALSSEALRPFSVEEGLVGKTYSIGESTIVDDVSAHEAAKPPEPYGSALSVPIDGHGVFVAVTAEPGAFVETDRELAELMITHTESALDHVSG